ncbi:CLUMA_CG003726, isoform A [Clunio marinus]|uniref:CLUMA_CG003726, isoform A n=1 Tax=Clunio marinus TaxID=568069 RepID=A0A1J1HPM1_9DIPT|nr:CLUMA_CG003726, isoform A [Clunio marinus]
MELSKDYRQLAYITGGSLTGIFILALCSEIFLISDGFESHKKTFTCLVNYLEKQNVTDEYFKAAHSYEYSLDDCKSIVKEQNETFFIDLKTRMHCFDPIYNASTDRCDNFSFCNEDRELDDEYKVVCANFQASLDKNSIKKSVNKCEKLSKCFNCVAEKLRETNYEEIKFHARAINLTVIEFQIWKYFTIAPRTKELQEQGQKLEDLMTNLCVNEKKCETAKMCA